MNGALWLRLHRRYQDGGQVITLHRINHIHAGTFKLRYPQNSDICSYVDKEKQNLTERERVKDQIYWYSYWFEDWIFAVVECRINEW